MKIKNLLLIFVATTVNYIPANAADSPNYWNLLNWGANAAGKLYNEKKKLEQKANIEKAEKEATETRKKALEDKTKDDEQAKKHQQQLEKYKEYSDLSPKFSTTLSSAKKAIQAYFPKEKSLFNQTLTHIGPQLPAPKQTDRKAALKTIEKQIQELCKTFTQGLATLKTNLTNLTGQPAAGSDQEIYQQYKNKVTDFVFNLLSAQQRYELLEKQTEKPSEKLQELSGFISKLKQKKLTEINLKEVETKLTTIDESLNQLFVTYLSLCNEQIKTSIVFPDNYSLEKIQKNEVYVRNLELASLRTILEQISKAKRQPILTQITSLLEQYKDLKTFSYQAKTALSKLETTQQAIEKIELLEFNETRSKATIERAEKTLKIEQKKNGFLQEQQQIILAQEQQKDLSQETRAAYKTIQETLAAAMPQSQSSLQSFFLRAEPKKSKTLKEIKETIQNTLQDFEEKFTKGSTTLRENLKKLKPHQNFEKLTDLQIYDKYQKTTKKLEKSIVSAQKIYPFLAKITENAETHLKTLQDLLERTHDKPLLEITPQLIQELRKKQKEIDLSFNTAFLDFFKTIKEKKEITLPAHNLKQNHWFLRQLGPEKAKPFLEKVFQKKIKEQIASIEQLIVDYQPLKEIAPEATVIIQKLEKSKTVLGYLLPSNLLNPNTALTLISHPGLIGKSSSVFDFDPSRIESLLKTSTEDLKQAFSEKIQNHFTKHHDAYAAILKFSAITPEKSDYLTSIFKNLTEQTPATLRSFCKGILDVVIAEIARHHDKIEKMLSSLPLSEAETSSLQHLMALHTKLTNLNKNINFSALLQLDITKINQEITQTIKQLEVIKQNISKKLRDETSPERKALDPLLKKQNSDDIQKEAIRKYIRKKTKEACGRDQKFEQMDTLCTIFDLIKKAKLVDTYELVAQYTPRTTKEIQERIFLAALYIDSILDNYSETKNLTALYTGCLELLKAYRQKAAKNAITDDNEIIDIVTNCQIALAIKNVSGEAFSNEQIKALLFLYTHPEFSQYTKVCADNPFINIAVTANIAQASAIFEAIHTIQDQAKQTEIKKQVDGALREALFIHTFLSHENVYIPGYILLEHYEASKANKSQDLAKIAIKETLTANEGIEKCFVNGKSFIPEYESLTHESQHHIRQFLRNSFSQAQKNAIDNYLNTLQKHKNDEERETAYLSLFKAENDIQKITENQIFPKVFTEEEQSEASQQEGLQNTITNLGITIAAKLTNTTTATQNTAQKIYNIIKDPASLFDGYPVARWFWENRTWLIDNAASQTIVMPLAPIIAMQKTIDLIVNIQNSNQKQNSPIDLKQIKQEIQNNITNIEKLLPQRLAQALIPRDENGKAPALQISVIPAINLIAEVLHFKSKTINPTTTIIKKFQEEWATQQKNHKDQFAFKSWAETEAAINQFIDQPQKNKEDLSLLIKKTKNYLKKLNSLSATMQKDLEEIEAKIQADPIDYTSIKTDLIHFTMYVSVILTWDLNKKGAFYGACKAFLGWLDTQEEPLKNEWFANPTLANKFDDICKNAQREAAQDFITYAEKAPNRAELETMIKKISMNKYLAVESKTYWNQWAKKQLIEKSTQQDAPPTAAPSHRYNKTTMLLCTGSAITVAGIATYILYKKYKPQLNISIPWLQKPEVKPMQIIAQPQSTNTLLA